MSATDKKSGSDGYLFASLPFRAIALSATDSDETDVQVQVTITYSANMLGDFGDIRFYDSDKVTLLNYYLESYTDSTTANFIVSVPSKPAAGKNIYVYYGVAGATTTSSGVDTFVFFDDFTGIANGQPPDPTKWEVYRYLDGYLTEPNDWCKVVDETLYLRAHLTNYTWARTIDTLGVGYGFKVRARRTPNCPALDIGYTGNETYSSAGSAFPWSYWRVCGSNIAASITDEEMHIIEMQRISATHRKGLFDNVVEYDGEDVCSFTDDAHLYLTSSATVYWGAYFIFDWVARYKISAATYEVGEEEGGELYITRWRATFNSDVKNVTDSSCEDWKEKIPAGFVSAEGTIEAFILDGTETLDIGSAITLVLYIDENTYWSGSGYITEKPITVELQGEAVKVSYRFEGTGTYTETVNV